MKSSLLGLAILLGLAWVVLRIFLAVSGFFLHLIWIAALIFLVLWVVQWLRGR